MKDVSLGDILKDYCYKSIWRQLDVWILVLQYIYMKCPEKLNLLRQKVDQWLTWAVDRNGECLNGYEFYFEGDENVLK